MASVAGLLDWVAAVLDAVGRALVLDSSLLVHAQDPGFLSIAAGVALLAGVMTMVGHSVILFVNGVSGFRFGLALLGTGLWTVFLYGLQGVVVGLAAGLVLDAQPPWWQVLSLVLVSSAPLCFGFLILLPYSGPAIGRVLELWSFVVMMVAVDAVFGVSAWTALLLTGVGWLAKQAVARLVAGPLGWVVSRAWRLVTGRPALISARDVLAGHPFVDVVGPAS